MAWPEGVTHAYDLPWNFVTMWQQAMMIIGWQENLSDDDMPPRVIWGDSKKLEAHFALLKKKWSGKSDEVDKPYGSFDDAIKGRDVQVKNRFGDFAKESLSMAYEDYSDF